LEIEPNFGDEKFLKQKIFHGAILKSIFLSLINNTSDYGLHGYAISKAVRERFGISVSPSTLYPELKRLEEQGLIASNWEVALGRARKQYRITRKGQGLLREYYMELEAVIPLFVTCRT
jgi:DNA-binding PadR family transcriptional regulator